MGGLQHGLCFVYFLLMSSSSAAVTLTKPSISLRPRGKISWGQKARITCSTSHLHVTFAFMKTSSVTFIKTVRSTPNSTIATFDLTQVTFDSEGIYRCQLSRGNLQSPLSDAVILSVKVTLPKPSISADFRSEVIWGTDVVIKCSVSMQHLGGKFILKRTSGSFSLQSHVTAFSSATFHIRQVNFDNEGSYWCQYQTSVSSRNVLSPKSDHISFSVIVPQPQPEITLSSPDGALQWSPGAVEVTWGHSFVINCSVPSHYPGGRFTLIFSGSTANDIKPAVNQSASFEFPTANYGHQGNYSCVYEVTLSSRKFTSVEASISVVVKLPLLMLVSSISAGTLLLLLLLVPLVIFLVCKRRKQTRQHGVPSLTPMAVRNHYEGSSGDGEPHYMNIDTVRCKDMQWAQTCRTLDENPYEENEWSDDSHDYEEELSSGDDLYVNAIQAVNTPEM